MSRFGIPSHNAYGVAMKGIKTLGTMLGRNQPLAVALWGTGVYEARMLASFVGDPERLTALQMERWCKDFDNWAFCDAMSFNLFDRTPHAWTKVAQWSSRRNEFEKRTAFALLWSLTVHDKAAAMNALNRASPSSNAKRVMNAILSRRRPTWPCARSANAIAHSIPRP
jgi:3-methyladenine DNA glycosylase AlkD